MSNYTAQDVKDLSRKLGIGLHEAKAKFDKLEMIQQISEAKTVEDIKPILLALAQRSAGL